jgi:hypothetical protein
MNQSWSMTLKRAAVFVLRPTLLMFGLVLAGAYKLIFGWWLDERSHRKRYENFRKELQVKVPALFTKLDGKFVPNDRKYPRAFDYVVVSVSVQGMVFRYIRGREDFTVAVALETGPGGWREASEVVRSSPQFSESNGVAEYHSLNGFGRFLDANFSILQEEVAGPEWKAERYGVWPI